MTKEQKTIKELKAQVEALEEKLKDSKYWEDYYRAEAGRLREEINQVHDTLDAMTVPRKGAQDNNMTLSGRLTLLVTMIGLRSTITVRPERCKDTDF